MIICVCHNISDKAVRAEVRNGVHCVEGLSAQLGIATCCGCCRSCAQEIINEELEHLANSHDRSFGQYGVIPIFAQQASAAALAA